MIPIAALMIGAACSNAGLARLAVDPDTLVINGLNSAMTIPVRALRANGSEISNPMLSFTSSSAAVRVWKDGRVGCTRAGDATVTVAAGAVTTRVAVWCRPNLLVTMSGGVNGPFGDQLWVGGPPHDIAVAVSENSKIVRMPRGAPTAAVEHDSVARIVGGRIYGLSRGRTRIVLEYNGARGGAQITVVERAVHDSVSLVGGAQRTWRVTPGYYEIRLDSARNAPALDLWMYRANCAHAPRDGGPHYFCVFTNGSSIIVQNSRPIGARSELRGELTVLRLPESP